VPVLTEVELVVGDDVVEASADQAERDRPYRHVHDGAGAAASGDPAPLAEPDGDDDPENDHQGVSAERQGPEVDDPL
jgi:hypothetical protein